VKAEVAGASARQKKAPPDFQSAGLSFLLQVAVQRGFSHLAFLEHHDPLIRCLDGEPGFKLLLGDLRDRNRSDATL